MKGHIVLIRPHLRGALLDGIGTGPGDMGSGDGGLQAEVVVGAQVHQALMDAVNPVEMRELELSYIFVLFLQLLEWYE